MLQLCSRIRCEDDYVVPDVVKRRRRQVGTGCVVEIVPLVLVEELLRT